MNQSELNEKNQETFEQIGSDIATLRTSHPSTGTPTLDRISGRFYGESTPLTGNITVSDTGAKNGGTIYIYHNASEKPTITTSLNPYWVGGENRYAPDERNLIAMQKMGNTLVIVVTNELETSAPAETAPTVPQNLSATNIGDTSFTLNWDASTSESSFTWNYKIWQDGVVVKTVSQNELSTIISGLEPETTYEMRVSAIDDENRESALSSPLSVTTDEEVIIVKDPSEVGMQIWYDGTDESNKTFDTEITTRITEWRNKINNGNAITQSSGSFMPLKEAGNAYVSLSGNKNMTGDELSILSSYNDFHFFIVFRAIQTSNLNILVHNTLGSNDRFAISIDNDILSVSSRTGSHYPKSAAFTDTTNFHVLECKRTATGDITYAELDGVEMTGDVIPSTTTNPLFSLGYSLTVNDGNDRTDFTTKCVCAKSSHLTTQERAELLNYLNSI